MKKNEDVFNASGDIETMEITPEKNSIDPLHLDLGREDLNKLVDTVNQLIEVNNSRM